MAGRTRRTGSPSQQQAAPEENRVGIQVWQTAIYARLSLENSGREGDTSSIEEQIAICKTYIEEQSDLTLTDTYMDNGWTGTNTDRPEFQRMLGDLRRGRINAVVVKDFSRFSRNYIEAGTLFEREFPALGVRFISVNDRYDSLMTDGSAEGLLIPLKNMINSFYSMDISKKVSTAIHTRQASGEFLPRMIPYGYLKSDTDSHRLVPDPETRQIVTRIFQERATGKSNSAICHQLNDEGIPSPGKLRYLRGEDRRDSRAASRWTVATIRTILENPTYTGDLVFGRVISSLYQGITTHKRQEKSQWVTLSDMHEPLVDRETFAIVQKLAEASSQAWQKRVDSNAEKRAADPDIFCGRVYCGDCGYRMYFVRSATSPAQYICSGHTRHDCSTTHRIAQDKLKKAVWDTLSAHSLLLGDMQKMIDRLNQTGKKTEKQKLCDQEIQEVLEKIQKCQDRRLHLYDSYSEGVLSPEEYVKFKRQYDEESEQLSGKLSDLQTEQHKMDKLLSRSNRWLKTMLLFKDYKAFDSKMLEALVERVNVYQVGKERRVEVVLKYSEDFAELMAAKEEQERRLR